MSDPQHASVTRCTERGCPVRYASGPDRPCDSHRADQLADAMTTRMMEGTDWRQRMYEQDHPSEDT
jgi:hypothetical protein